MNRRVDMHIYAGKKIKNAIPALAMSVAAAAVLAGCGSSGRESAAKMTSYTSANSGAEATLFTVPQDQLPHIQIITISSGPLVRTLRLSGQVAYNGFKTTPVITAVGGPVSRVLVFPGQHVRVSQPMLEVSSPDYSQLRATYLKARDTDNLANKNYQRAQDLYAHHAISEADLLQAESVRTQAQTDMNAAEQGLHILGITDLDSLATAPVSAQIPVRAPISGEVVERQCSPGQLIQAGATQCFTISDMSTVWVLVNVYQNQLSYIHNGDVVSVQTDAYPAVFHGKISYLAPAVDPNTRTLQARIVTQNPGEKLKNQMYVTATVVAGKIPKAITVPVASVMRNTENQPFVYVQTGSTQFSRRMVEIGETQEGRIEILSGLSPGEKVVADGSLFLQFQNSLQR
ncbi:MAG TPA: efflux RND transporter periplasmic adaptor subunit [Candidatus Acidoferrales bacterium]|nr:efflux RND transporter periplasmic adaptor subunit [Candidatus Acidoferrales bacterium]